jgi:hypothetical protein
METEAMPMEEELRRKAYNQGFNSGLNGFNISQADWEAEFLPHYIQGYTDGKVERLGRRFDAEQTGSDGK